VVEQRRWTGRDMAMIREGMAMNRWMGLFVFFKSRIRVFWKYFVAWWKSINAKHASAARRRSKG
jgi:hypothetical protein